MLSGPLVRKTVVPVVAFAVLALTARGAAGLTVPGGRFCNDVTWTQNDSPVVLTGSVIVGGGSCSGTPTLSIGPGVEVRIGPNRIIDVFGALVARGTANAPILFTANVKSPPSPWFGIRFETGAVSATVDVDGNYVSGSILEYCTIELASDQGSTLGVLAGNSVSPFLNEVTVRNCSYTTAAIGISGNVSAHVRAPHILGNPGTGAGLYLATVSADILGGEFVLNAGIPINVVTGVSTMTGVRVANNGGVVVLHGTINAVTSCMITGNAGGGLRLGGGTNTVRSSTISDNGNVGVDVGSDTVAVFGPALVEDNVIERNSTYGVRAGCYVAGPGGTATIQRNTIVGTGGTGIQVNECYGASMSIADNTIRQSAGGPGLLVSSGGQVTVTGNCFSRNNAAGQGASGVESDSATVGVSRNTFVGNDDPVIQIGAGAIADIEQNNLIFDGPFTDSGPFFMTNLRAQGTADVPAGGNWWATTQGVPLGDLNIAFAIFDFFDDGRFGIVDSGVPASGPIAEAPDVTTCLTGAATTTTTSTSTSSTSSTRSTTSTSTSTHTTSSSTSTSTSTSTTQSTSTSSSSSTSSITTTSSSSSTSNSNPTTSSTSSSSSSAPTTSSSSTSSTSSTSTSSSSSSSSSVTSTTSTTSSSSTTVPRCGNGVLDAGEECDPGPPDSADRFCCTPACRVNTFRINSNCGAERALGACELHDVCDAGGRCVGAVQQAGQSCRDPGTNGLCDLGDVCDGVAPDCPVNGDLPCAIVGPEQQGKKTVAVLCRAPKPDSGSFKCSATGFEAAAGGAARPAAGAPTAECTTTSRRVSPNLTVRLKGSTDPLFVERAVKLKLNDFGRALLRKQGTLNVCIQVKVTAGRTVLETRFELATIHR